MQPVDQHPFVIGLAHVDCESQIAGAVSGTIRDSLLWNGYGLNLARQGRFVVDANALPPALAAECRTR